jgi:hypothetical protein
MTKPTTVKSGIVCIGFAAVILLSGCRTAEHSGAGAETHARLTSFSQEITSPVHEFQTKVGDTYTLDITAKNTGTEPWSGGQKAMSVQAGYRWLDSKGNALPIEGNRAALDRPVVQPGESDTLKLQVAAPSTPGSYTLWVSMVQEGVAWFYIQGAKPLVLQATVN